MARILSVLAGACLALAGAQALAEEIGSVNTNFRLTGSDKVAHQAFADPIVPGLSL